MFPAAPPLPPDDGKSSVVKDDTMFDRNRDAGRNKRKFDENGERRSRKSDSYASNKYNRYEKEEQTKKRGGSASFNNGPMDGAGNNMGGLPEGFVPPLPPNPAPAMPNMMMPNMMGNNMSPMAGNMGNMANNMGGNMGNMANMTGNMGNMAGNMGNMGNMAGNMANTMGNMGNMAGNMGNMAGNMGNMAGNMGNMAGMGMNPMMNNMMGANAMMGPMGMMMGGQFGPMMGGSGPMGDGSTMGTMPNGVLGMGEVSNEFMTVFSKINTRDVIEFSNFSLYPPPPNAPPPTTRDRPLGCKTIFVGGLPENFKENQLEELFSKCGEIQNTRLSSKRFAHIRFMSEMSVDIALYFSGYRVRIEGNTDAPNTGRIHIDFAQARDDQYEYECQQRALDRERRHVERMVIEQFRVPSPIPVVHYSDHEAASLGEKLKSVDTFQEALDTMVTWLERGECNKRNANHFYTLLQSTNSHVRHLVSEKSNVDEMFQQARDMRDASIRAIAAQYQTVEKVFSAASQKKVWDHFSKAQRKSIDAWKKAAADIKSLMPHEDSMDTDSEDEGGAAAAGGKNKMKKQGGGGGGGGPETSVFNFTEDEDPPPPLHFGYSSASKSDTTGGSSSTSKKKSKKHKKESKSKKGKSGKSSRSWKKKKDKDHNREEESPPPSYGGEVDEEEAEEEDEVPLISRTRKDTVDTMETPQYQSQEPVVTATPSRGASRKKKDKKKSTPAAVTEYDFVDEEEEQEQRGEEEEREEEQEQRGDEEEEEREEGQER
uniref:Ecto-NOX disulfide-thiol exchanger 1 n=1 Tax=Cacopsylla melanoneura TaxID=428564 RepID=A0A8D8UYX3_9HEMI